MTLSIPLLSLAAQFALQDRFPVDARMSENDAGSTVSVARIEHSTRPIIDGKSDDAIWQFADPISNFTQDSPQFGEDPSFKTRVRFALDGSHIFVLAEMEDAEPERIVTSTLTRDADLTVDDHIQIMIDPRRTGRDAFIFRTNPDGAREDLLLENNSTLRREWDVDWDVATQKTDRGWVAEFAIPVRNLGGAGTNSAWNIQVVRGVARLDEIDQWVVGAGPARGTRIVPAGQLDGMDELSIGNGLQVTGYSTSSFSKGYNDESDSLTTDPSLDVEYRVTEELTAALSLNPDFSDRPLDDRQINLTRFSLFTPETRDLFLRDSGVFEFGGRPFDGSSNGRPYFSRNIGFVNGSPVGIDGAARLVGSLDRFNIGAIIARTKATDDISSQTLSVARGTVDLGRLSKAGFIATHGDPNGGSNTTVGSDIQMRWQLDGGRRLEADAYVIHSRDGIRGNGTAFGGEIAYPNDDWFARLRYRYSSSDYRPALGFANRTGIQEFTALVNRRWRFNDGLVRRFDIQNVLYGIYALNGRLQTGNTFHQIRARNAVGDEAQAYLRFDRDVVERSFFLPGGIEVSPGDYRDTRWSIALQSSTTRPMSFTAQFSCCDWYGGTQESLFVTSRWRPTRHFGLSASAWRRDIRLPSGDVTIDTASIEANVNFSTDMQFVSEVEYDNQSNQLSYLGRLFWQLMPSSELNLTLSHRSVTDFRNYRAEVAGVAIRIQHRLWL